MISMIIPCYWKDDEMLDMTIRCLNSLNDTTGGERPEQVLVVDDGSPVDVELEDESGFKQVIKQMRLDENRGYAAAVNTGLHFASGDIFIIANNDLEFIQSDWLDHLLKPLKEGAGVSLIRQTDCDGWTTEDKYTENDKFGALWAMTREVYEKVGPMDERFGKGYFDDLDYWRRVQDAGYKIVKNHNGLVHHLGKQTFKHIDPKDTLFGKNLWVYKEKWGDKAYVFESEPNSLLLIDDYEIKDERQREIARKKDISLEEARRRWQI